MTWAIGHSNDVANIDEKLESEGIMEQKEQQLQETFVRQMEDWSKTGTIPEIAGMDMQYAFELQKKRLMTKHVQLQYHFTPNELGGMAMHSEVSINGFTNRVSFREYQVQTDYLVDGVHKYRRNCSEIMYANVTDLVHPNMVTTATCPNCGAISHVQEFIKGCPSCGTRFSITDFYPKVTQFYTIDNTGVNQKEVKSKATKYILSGVAISVLIALLSCIFTGEWYYIIGVLPGAFFGAIFGYFVYAIGLLFKVIGKAVASVPLVVGNMSAEPGMKGFMKRYQPDFSFQFFAAKMLNLLRIMIYSDEYDNLAVYEGAPLTNTFRDIIDVKYRGGLSLSRIYMEGEDCHVELGVYVTVTYCNSRGIRERNETYKLHVFKNISKPDDFGFSIREYECRNCGASFDAAKERHCPYCGSNYHMKENDWMVLELKR